MDNSKIDGCPKSDISFIYLSREMEMHLISLIINFSTVRYLLIQLQQPPKVHTWHGFCGRLGLCSRFFKEPVRSMLRVVA